MSTNIPAVHVKLKRAYEPADPSGGTRVLVDRLWPRGVSKKEVTLGRWMKEIAPSTGLQKWFGHDPALERVLPMLQRRAASERRFVGELRSIAKRRAYAGLFRPR